LEAEGYAQMGKSMGLTEEEIAEVERSQEAPV
jgi:hypothetical protein